MDEKGCVHCLVMLRGDALTRALCMPAQPGIQYLWAVGASKILLRKRLLLSLVSAV